MQDVWNVGCWRVDLREGWIRKRASFLGREVRPDARLMAVLRVLIESEGRTVSAESILKLAWPNRVVSRDSVTTAIYQLRRLLGDRADRPVFIASDPMRGYRLVAELSAVEKPASGWAFRGGAAALVVVAVASWAIGQTAQPQSYVYVEPIQNYAESPLQGPLSTAVEAVFLSELIQSVPAVVSSADSADVTFRLQSMMVACELGPTLVVRLLDARDESYVWSQTYNLDEVAALGSPPSLVEMVAADVAAAIP